MSISALVYLTDEAKPVKVTASSEEKLAEMLALWPKDNLVASLIASLRVINKKDNQLGAMFALSERLVFIEESEV